MSLIEDVPKITPKAFKKISAHVEQHYGINLTEAKLNLVEYRLMKRIRDLNLSTFDEYTDHVFGIEGRDELNLLCDYLSTNKTYFYREPSHFDFVEEIVKTVKPYGSLSIWSVACSGGDEVYTLSAILEESNRNKIINYSILGSDISSRMIAEAGTGEYNYSRISQLPSFYVKKYFTQNVDSRGNEIYRVKDSLKHQVRFKKFNLIKDMHTLQVRFDIVFCRNVLIYFNEETKKHVITELLKKVKPGGYLILAHCEGMLCRNMNLKQIQPAVFQKPINE